MRYMEGKGDKRLVAYSVEQLGLGAVDEGMLV